MLAHKIIVSVFVKHDEDCDFILDKLKTFTGVKKVLKTEATGLEDNLIMILECLIDKKKDIETFFKTLSSLPRKQKDILTQQLDSRLDIHNNFFIRLDKDKFLEDVFEVTDSGNCIHIKIVVAAFPKTKENAKKIVLEFIDKNI
tara:strand:+ start:1140 stop:1571 length:432 start_codon:yes stop_codon:yes gene_type:complete